MTDPTDYTAVLEQAREVLKRPRGPVDRGDYEVLLCALEKASEEAERLRTSIVGHCRLLSGHSVHTGNVLDCLSEVHMRFQSLEAEIDDLRDEVETLRGRPHWKRIAPDSSPAGELCGLCDSLDPACSHPRVECSRCGRQGLQENWPFDCCGVTR